jgi:bacteriocin-like protein
MSKSKTMTLDTSKAGKATALTDDELKAVSGGAVDLKGASEALTQCTVQAHMLRLSSK